MTDGRRLRWLEISSQMLVQTLRDGFGPASVESDALPDDCTVWRAEATETGNLRLVLMSASFDPVPEGMRIPEIRPTYRTLESPTK